MDGYFRRPTAIDCIGHDLYVVDAVDNSITVFVPTEFGQLVYDAIEQFDQGKALVAECAHDVFAFVWLVGFVCVGDCATGPRSRG